MPTDEMIRGLTAANRGTPPTDAQIRAEYKRQAESGVPAKDHHVERLVKENKKRRREEQGEVVVNRRKQKEQKQRSKAYFEWEKNEEERFREHEKERKGRLEKKLMDITGWGMASNFVEKLVKDAKEAYEAKTEENRNNFDAARVRHETAFLSFDAPTL